MFSEPSSNLSKLGLTDGMKVVDLGAGSGFYTLEAGRRVGNNGRVYAVDVQRDLLDRIRNTASSEGLRNIEVIWGNAEKIGGTKLREGVADRAIASNVLFQNQKLDDFALEIKRIVKPGGKLMVIDWNGTGSMSPANIVSEEKAKTVFEKNGFKLESSFEAGDHHYGLVFSR